MKITRNYQWVYPHIKLTNPDSVILECGCHGGQDTVGLSRSLKRKVIGFEALPHIKNGFEVRKKENPDVDIQLVNKAISNKHNQIIEFYQPNKKFKYSASIFSSTKNAKSHKVMDNGYIKHDVESVALGKWIKENNLEGQIELIVMDLQGAEYQAIQGLIPIDKSIKYIAVEANFTQVYDNIPLIKDIANLLKTEGFIPIASSSKYPSIDMIQDFDPDTVEGDIWNDVLFMREN
jgi:FkbM family methyltransferase